MQKEEKNIININREKLSTIQVRKKENLEGILNQHKMITKRPVYKRKRFYFFLFLLLVITFLLYSSDKENKEQKAVQTEQSK